LGNKLEILIKYTELLKSKNKFINLTSFDEDEFFLEVVVDSLVPWYIGIMKNFEKVKVLDIGTGAGIPGIPLAIVLEKVHFSLIDSKKKKIDFVKYAKKMLNLENVTTYCERVESFALKNLKAFDTVISRAVGEVVILLEYAAPLLKIGGNLILFKGQKIEKELEKSRKITDLLGFSMPNVIIYKLNEDKERNLVVFEKVSETPERFPRKPGMAVKRPLA